MTGTADAGYRAFLSYSHRDMTWATWLHKKLEKFPISRDLIGRPTNIGTVPQSLRPIFRDRDEFVGGHRLSEATALALDASNALIVLCSPNAAQSEYVNEEVRQFRNRHPDRPVIPVVVDGKHPDNFPPALLYDVSSDGRVAIDRPVTILATDLRESGDGKALGLSKIVAGLVGVGTDEIMRRAQLQQRRRFVTWMTGASIITVAMTGLAAWAEVNRQSAVRRFELAADAASDLTILQATHRALTDSRGMPVIELLDNTKLNSAIFSSMRAEGPEWQCRKLRRLANLVDRTGQLTDAGQRFRLYTGIRDPAVGVIWNEGYKGLQRRYGNGC